MTSPFNSGLSDRARSALDEFIDAARQAGEIAMRDFRSGRPSSVRVHLEQGGSPVTDADLAIDRYLSERLRTSFPGTGWVSEEAPDDPARALWASVVIVDPIDGTRSFLAGDPRWTVSIALVHDGDRSPGGARARPRRDLRRCARPRREPQRRANSRLGAQRARRRASRRADGDDRRAGQGRRRPIRRRAARSVVGASPGSVASGAPDIGIGSPGAHDWDIAAADVILREAGARLAEADGRPPRYNNETATLHGAVVASGAGLSAALAAAAGRAFGAGAR